MSVFAFVRFVCFKQKTAYEMRISDWSSDVCSSDLMSGVIRAAMNHLTNADVVDDTSAILAWLDAQAEVSPGKVGCVGHCMSGQYITTVSARFPHRSEERRVGKEVCQYV